MDNKTLTELQTLFDDHGFQIVKIDGDPTNGLDRVFRFTIHYLGAHRSYQIRSLLYMVSPSCVRLTPFHWDIPLDQEAKRSRQVNETNPFLSDHDFKSLTSQLANQMAEIEVKQPWNEIYKNDGPIQQIIEDVEKPIRTKRYEREELSSMIDRLSDQMALIRKGGDWDGAFREIESFDSENKKPDKDDEVCDS